MAAQQGFRDAQYNLAFMHYKGYGVLQNYKEAMKWYLSAAENGLAAAQFTLGVMYLNGEGVPKDNVQAYMWFSLARANGIEEAKKLLKTEPQGFDLVITDLVMPKMSGNYLISVIKKEFPDILVIAMTGWDSYPETFIHEAQADKILEKPFKLSELDKTIKELLPSQNHKVKN